MCVRVCVCVCVRVRVCVHVRVRVHVHMRVRVHLRLRLRVRVRVDVRVRVHVRGWACAHVPVNRGQTHEEACVCVCTRFSSQTHLINIDNQKKKYTPRQIRFLLQKKEVIFSRCLYLTASFFLFLSLSLTHTLSHTHKQNFMCRSHRLYFP